jgi:catechol 2,3-dioxygenase-like lactoylglutathione lyase family enzyme
MVETFKILRLDHVNVTYPEELESEVLSWYENSLGLERVTKPDGTRPAGGWFRAGDQEIHLSLDEHNPPKTAHMGLVVDDFDAVVSRLRDAGCHIEQASEIPGRRRCYTRDPAGNRIEIAYLDDVDGDAEVEFEEDA